MAITAELETGLDVGALYAAQAGRVHRFVRASVRAPEPVIEDACSFAWSRLLLHRARLRRETAPAWLVSTAVHEAFKLIRRERRDVSLDELIDRATDSGWSGSLPVVPSLEEVAARRARLATVSVLPERQQCLLWLQAFCLGYVEMAEQTDATVRTVERQILRARRALVRADA
jgi:DNA-directed RNA polymerase specialized sigma24 family protein